MKIQRNTSAIRRISLLLLLSMLLSVFTGYSYTASAEELTEAEQATIQTEKSHYSQSKPKSRSSPV